MYALYFPYYYERSNAFMIICQNKEYTIEEFTKLCKESESYRELSMKLGYSGNSGSTVSRLKKLIL
jgi:hypothetical protein